MLSSYFLRNAILALLSVCLVYAQSKTTYVPIGGGADAVLYEPVQASTKSRIVVIYAHPSGNNFNHAIGRQLSARGYRALMLNTYGDRTAFEAYAAPLAAVLRKARSLEGVSAVVFVTHSGGGPMMSFYQNLAENGPKACAGPEKIVPCKGNNLTGLPKADGLVLLDSVPGEGFHWMTGVDPAVGAGHRPRNADLDVFEARNGYDAAAKKGTYSPEFTRKYFQTQSSRNAQILQTALAKLEKIEKGQSEYKDNEPFLVQGVGVGMNAPRLYQLDPRLISHTRKPHMLLKADGTKPEQIVTSVRPASGSTPANLGTLANATQSSTIREFLSGDSIRTTADYAMTEDNITGVDWASSMNSVPSNVEGITVPTLVVAMSCHYFVVPSEIIFEHSAAKDKQYAAVEGATHGFMPCKPEYGDTQKRLFDYVDSWLDAGRFRAQ